MEIIKSERGYLTILAGKTDMGKSTITIYDTTEHIREGQNVIFFSLEYVQSIIVNKMVSHFGLNWADLFKCDIVDASGWNIDMIENAIRAKAGWVDVVYIDYLDLVKEHTFGPKANFTDEERMNHTKSIVAQLADLAKRMDITIVLLSQTGAHTEFEVTIQRLNKFTEGWDNTYKMFIGKGNVIDSRISFDDISHLILVDGYNLKHFSSINIKEVYQDK
ncbi:MAG: DnaB helicase C-terminal domain-containing protein [Bacilli bacterium]|nr:DnaB helicase C-terminal domain-containing protein [Bacilli bacterium]